MNFSILTSQFNSNWWQVFVLFLVPIGGGIPAGVLLAQKYGILWPVTAFLYFLSDVVLACVFEPIMLVFIHWAEKRNRFVRLREVLQITMDKITKNYGLKPSPWNLVMITFGTDPMTGRSIAKAVGHGFLTGWALTIMGDMIFFSVIMVSTLWLSSILGNGTGAVIIILIVMMGLPPLLEKWRARKNTPPI